ncbi:hypothetical protein BGX26_003321, partial [Mortierella sp. AD094]
HLNAAVEETQSFRLIGTTDTVEINVNHVGRQNIVYWEDIEQVFPGVKHVQNGKVAVNMLRGLDGTRIMPHCIKHFPNVVLDVVLSSTTEHVHVDSSVGVPSMVSTIALTTALTIGRTDPPSKDKFVEGLRVISALAETPISDICARTSSSGPSSLPPSSPNKSDSQVQLQELSANIAHMIKLQEAFDAKQEEMKQLQKQALDQQEEMERLQKRVLDHQEEMNQLQIQNKEKLRQMRVEVAGQFSVLQTGVHAVPTQTYELHEHLIPHPSSQEKSLPISPSLQHFLSTNKASFSLSNVLVLFSNVL